MGVEVLLGLAVASEAIGAFQSFNESKAVASQADAAARQTLIETEEQATISKRRSRQLKSKQLVGFLKSGVQLEGTPLDVLSFTEQLGKEDVASIRRQGRAQATQFLRQGQTARQSGRLRLLSGLLGAASTFAGGSQRVSRLRGTGSTGGTGRGGANIPNPFGG